jgi:energy-coupling factor transporter ATP-binding protein EcfA2
MKKDRGYLRFCEAEIKNGERYVAVCKRDLTKIDHIPLQELPDTDPYFKYLKTTDMLWPLPNEITLYEYRGMHTDWETGHKDVTYRVYDISKRILHCIENYTDLQDDLDPVKILLFVLNSYFVHPFKKALRLLVKGTSGSGKSRILEILMLLCHHGESVIEGTRASVQRMIQHNDATPLLDETRDMKKEMLTEVLQIWKSGDSPLGKITRVNQNTGLLETHSVYAPMFVSALNDGGFGIEIKNRAFVINMIESGRRLPRLNEKEFDDLRTDLYSLFALFRLHPKLFGINDLIEESARQLGENGDYTVNVEYAINTKEELIGRGFDIALTAFTLAKLTGDEGIERDTLLALYDMRKKLKKSYRDETDADILCAFMEIIECKKGDSEFTRYDLDLDLSTIAREITTVEIKDKHNSMRTAQGNNDGGRKDAETRTITTRLEAMGIEIIRNGKGSGKSTIDVSGNFEKNLLTHLTKYDLVKEIALYHSLIKKKKS